MRCSKYERCHCHSNVERSGNYNARVSTDPHPPEWPENIEVHDEECVLEKQIDNC